MIFNQNMAEFDKNDVILQCLMVKRSQNKKRFTPVNYKQRWFVLTKTSLIYYDIEGEVRYFIRIFMKSFCNTSHMTSIIVLILK